MKSSAKAGFSLIELMVVVVIVGVLSAVAYPSYLDYVRKGKRAEGKSAVLSAAQALERYMTANNVYTTDLSAAGYRAYSGESAATSAYTLAVAPGSTGTINSSYRITATAVVGWGKNSGSPVVEDDQGCGQLIIDQTGAKSVSGGTMSASQCW